MPSYEGILFGHWQKIQKVMKFRDTSLLLSICLVSTSSRESFNYNTWCNAAWCSLFRRLCRYSTESQSETIPLIIGRSRVVANVAVWRTERPALDISVGGLRPPTRRVLQRANDRWPCNGRIKDGRRSVTPASRHQSRRRRLEQSGDRPTDR